MTNASEQSASQTCDIINARGLHARAAAKFVKCVEGFEAEVTVSKDDQSVSGLSIMGLMMLAASPGTQIDITATGVQATEALEALAALIGDRFGEGE